MYYKYHHLDYLSSMQPDLESWKYLQREKRVFYTPEFQALNVANIHTMPEIGYSFISSNNFQMGKHIMRDLNNIPNDTVNHEYAGAMGEYMNEYVQRVSLQCQQFLLSSPNTPITLGYHSDGFCECCIIKAPGTNVGPHCVAEYGGIDDFIWEKTLDILGFQRPTPNETHTIQVGAIRELTASGELKEAHIKTDFEIKNESARFLREGILVKNSFGLTVVNPQRLRGKEY